MRVRSGLMLGLALMMTVALAGLGGCASGFPKPQTPLPAAVLVLVDGDSLPVIGFEKVVVDIPSQRGIGYHYAGLAYSREEEYRWNEHFVDETRLLNDLSREILAEAGYRVAGPGQGGLRLVGTVGQMKYNSYARKATTFDQVDCTVKWALFKAGQDEPDFTMTTQGSGRVADHKPGAIAAAYEVALRNLLGEPGFAVAVGGESAR